MSATEYGSDVHPVALACTARALGLTPPGGHFAGGTERLRVQNAELRMDHEFLKRAVAFLVTEQQSRLRPTTSHAINQYLELGRQVG